MVPVKELLEIAIKEHIIFSNKILLFLQVQRVKKILITKFKRKNLLYLEKNQLKSEQKEDQQLLFLIQKKKDRFLQMQQKYLKHQIQPLITLIFYNFHCLNQMNHLNLKSSQINRIRISTKYAYLIKNKINWMYKG